MEYSRESVGRVSLDEFVSIVVEIYSAQDKKRSIWDVWCHTLHHAAAIAERIRRESPRTELFKEIADFALWLFTAVHKFTGTFGVPNSPNETPAESLIRIGSSCSDLIWHKYPGLCPGCHARRTMAGERIQTGDDRSKPCDCSLRASLPQGKDSKRQALEALLRFSEKLSSTKPQGIDDWQRMFGRIFTANIKQLSLQEMALHLMEETGEASDAMIRMYTYKTEDFVEGEPNWRQLRLEAQTADLFSWLFALVEKINSSAAQTAEYEHNPPGASTEPRSVSLSQIIWNRYGSDELRSFYCPFCKRSKCVCPIVLVPDTRSVQELVGKFHFGANKRD